MSEPVFYSLVKYEFINAVFEGGYVENMPPEAVWFVIQKEGEEPVSLVLSELEAMMVLDILISALISRRVKEINKRNEVVSTNGSSSANP